MNAPIESLPCQERAKSSSLSLRLLGALDERLLQVLDAYLEQRGKGPVDHDEFIEMHADVASELPELLASIDALHRLAPDDRNSLSVEEAIVWEDLTAKTVGDYRILREIGRGGMGIVYEAQQISLDRRVALKVLPLTVVLDEQQIARFMFEAQAAAQLHHPNIVPIYSVGREDGLHCYSMPLIDGVSLDQWLADQRKNVQRTHGDSGSQPRDLVQKSVSLIAQAARALAHAHERGVIHRDIKPSNLLVDRTGKLWIADFGLARCRRDSKLTISGAIVGTLRYMSPEQASGKPQAIDHRSDIYSLGLTLYELVTGRAAFDNDSHLTLLSQRQYQEPRAPRRYNNRLSRDLETIVLKAIAVDVAERYQDAGEMADDLQRYLEGKPIRARRPSILDRVTKWTARHQKPLALAALIGLVALVASLIANSKFAKQHTELQTAVAEANANLRQANEHYRRTREVMDHFGLLAAEKLRGVAGAEAIREELVRDLLNYYEGFAAHASNDPKLREDLARTHFRAARIIEELAARERAIAAYQRAQDLFGQLAREDSRQDRVWEFQFHVGLCHNNMGLLYAEIGDYDRATEHYRQATSLQSRLVGRHPQAERELAGTRGNYGLMLAALGQRTAAQQELEKSLAMLQSIAHTEPAADLQISIAMTLNNLGYLFQDADVGKSLEYNQRAIKVLRSNSQQGKSRPATDCISALATSLNNQASLLVKLNRRPEALSMYQEALALYRDLVDRSPLVIRYTEELAITYNNYGRLLMRSGRNGDAAMSLNRSRDLLELLSQRRPSEVHYRISLGGVLNNLAKVSLRAGNLDQALAMFEESIEYQQAAEDSGADAERHRNILMTTYANYEQALRDAGRLLDAERVNWIRTTY